MNTAGHWFWWALTGACIAWYSTITIYVAIKGARDVRDMLRRLDSLEKKPPANPNPKSPHHAQDKIL